MGGGFLLSATSQSSRGDKKPSWKLRFDDTHIVHSNSGDLFVYDVAAGVGQRPGHRTLIVSKVLERTL